MQAIHSIFSSGLQCCYLTCWPEAPVPARLHTPPLFALVVNHPLLPSVPGVDAPLALRFAVRPVAVLLLRGRRSAAPPHSAAGGPVPAPVPAPGPAPAAAPGLWTAVGP